MMIALGGVTSFFVGNAFQAQMPEYAHDFGADEAGGWYSMLLAGNAAGAILGAILLETSDVLRPSARRPSSAPGLGPDHRPFALTRSYVVAGRCSCWPASSTSRSARWPRRSSQLAGAGRAARPGGRSLQHRHARQRAGSGLTVGVMGAVIGVHWSLALSSAAAVTIALALLARGAAAAEGHAVS